MRKTVAYLLVLLVLLYGTFLLLQAGGMGKNGYAHKHHLVRIGQLDPAQYASIQEYHTWAYSACSAAAMTEVANYYGGTYRITDILAVEYRIGEITPEQGLLEDAGIERTMAHFGFVTSWGYSLSLYQVVVLANEGTPVIVAFPPSRYPGGHLPCSISFWLKLVYRSYGFMIFVIVWRQFCWLLVCIRKLYRSV